MALDMKGFQKLAWYIQFLIVAGVMGGLLGLFWYQMLAPMGVEIEQKQAALDKLQQEIKKILVQKAQLERFKTESEAILVRINSKKSILPTERETDQIIRQIQEAASGSALRVVRYSPRTIVDKDVYLDWPWDLEVVGTYHNMGLFLDKILQLQRIVNVSNLRMATRPGDAQAVSIGAIFTATTFVYKEEPPTAAK